MARSASSQPPLDIDPTTTALLVIDVLEGGFLDSDQSQENIRFGERCARVVRACRAAAIPIIHCCDAHIPGLDRELELWGEHGVRGSEAAKPATLLGIAPEDFIIPKRRYSAFFSTDLDLTLRELGATTLIAIGADTNICVLHTLADAYYRTYETIVVQDATMTFLVGTQEGALEHIKACFGSQIVTTKELEAALAS